MDDTSLGKYSHDYSVIYGEEIARFYDVTDYIVFTGASKKISELVACMLKARKHPNACLFMAILYSSYSI